MLNNSNKESDRIYAQLSNKHDGIGDGGYVNGNVRPCQCNHRRLKRQTVVNNSVHQFLNVYQVLNEEQCVHFEAQLTLLGQQHYHKIYVFR